MKTKAMTRAILARARMFDPLRSSRWIRPRTSRPSTTPSAPCIPLAVPRIRNRTRKTLLPVEKNLILTCSIDEFTVICYSIGKRESASVPQDYTEQASQSRRRTPRTYEDDSKVNSRIAVMSRYILSKNKAKN